MSAIFIRHNGSGTHTTSVASWTFTPAAGYGTGHVALVAIRLQGSATVNSVTDSLGNTYVQVLTVALSTTIRMALWACWNTAAGTPTITVTDSAAISTKEIDVSEWAGVGNPAAATATNTASAATTTMDTGATASTSDIGALCLAVYALSGTGAGAATYTTDPNYTGLGDASAASSTRLLTQNHNTTAAGAQQAVGTFGVSATQANGIAVFPNVYSALGAKALASDSQLSGNLGAIAQLGAMALASDSGLFQAVITPLGSAVVAADSTLGGTLGHLGQMVLFTDYCPRSGTTYLYKARAVTAQGAYADSAPVAAGVVIAQGIYLHVLGQGSTTLHQFLWDVGEKVDRVQPIVAFVAVEGRQYPLAEFDETMTNATLTVNLRCYFDQGVTPPTSTDKKALDTIVYARGTVCFRDHRSRKTFGAIGDYQVTDLNLAYGVVLTITRSDDSDAV